MLNHLLTTSLHSGARTRDSLSATRSARLASPGNILMKVSRLKIGPVVALTFAVLGCASKPLTNVGLLGAAEGRDPLAPQNSAAAGAPAASFDVEATLQEAQKLRTVADYQGAAKLLSQLVLFSPDDPRVLAEYAKTLIGLGRSDDALAFVDRAIELQPGDWSLYSARGVALDQKADYPAAQMAYDRALALKPGDPTVLSNAAMSRVETGDLAGAEKLL